MTLATPTQAQQTQQAHPCPDYAAVKGRERQTWASGDFHLVAALVVPVSERLRDAAQRVSPSAGAVGLLRSVGRQTRSVSARAGIRPAFSS